MRIMLARMFNLAVALAALQAVALGFTLIIGRAPIYPILGLGYLLCRRYWISIREGSQQKDLFG